MLWPALAALGLSLFLAKMDYDLANTGRAAAHQMCAKYGLKPLWFEGHWGFQYYMEQLGAKPLEHDCSQPVPGEFVIVPSEAVNLFDLPTNYVRLVDTLQFTPNAHCTTMNSLAGAGFYAATAGPFPFSMAYVNPERYYVFEVVQPKCIAAKAPTAPFVAGAVMRQFEMERKIMASAQAPH